MAAKTVLFYDRERKFAQWRAEGYAEGYAEGWAEGFAKGKAEAEIRAAGFAEGKAAGIIEQDRKWQGWFARREAAQKAGLPFNEPPPAPLD